MKYGILGLAVAAAYYGLAVPARHHGAGGGALRQGSEWSWHGRLATGKTIEIRGVNGSISAEPASGAEVEVTARKHARRDDPDEVRIEVVEHEGGVTICAVYPGRRNRCEPGGGQMSTHDNDVEVEFTVRVPRGVAFDGNNVNGDVEAINLDGPVDAHTVNGGVRIETGAGEASAGTVNGSVRALVRGRGTESLHFATVNGGIDLTLPADLGADLEARTVNGTINSDFPVSVTGRINPRRLNGRIGSGGRRLDLETVNGSIRIRSLR
jgi:hypothetical protein